APARLDADERPRPRRDAQSRGADGARDRRAGVDARLPRASLEPLSREMMPRGLFIVLEGIDGTGKSTQAVRLGEWFSRAGHEVLISREPTDGPWGRKLRESAATGRLSADEELECFLEDRRQHVRELIEPALREGKVVILDRYYFSTMAYQGARG